MFNVMAKPCDQCLLSKNRIVSAKRAAQLCRDTVKSGGHFICHKATIANKDICCRLFFDAFSDRINKLRVFKRMGWVVEVRDD